MARRRRRHGSSGRARALVVGGMAGIAGWAAVAGPAGACSQAGFQNGVNLSGGQTVVSLAPATAAGLTRAGISLQSGPGPQATSAAVVLPVRGGLIWTESGWGSVSHGGRLTVIDRLTGRRLVVGGLLLNLMPTPDFTVTTADGGSLTLFRLSLAPQPATAINLVGGRGIHRRVDVGAIPLQLTGAAARTLDGALRTRVFVGGQHVGTARVSGQGTLAT